MHMLAWSSPSITFASGQCSLLVPLSSRYPCCMMSRRGVEPAIGYMLHLRSPPRNRLSGACLRHYYLAFPLTGNESMQPSSPVSWVSTRSLLNTFALMPRLLINNDVVALTL